MNFRIPDRYQVPIEAAMTATAADGGAWLHGKAVFEDSLRTTTTRGDVPAALEAALAAASDDNEARDRGRDAFWQSRYDRTLKGRAEAWLNGFKDGRGLYTPTAIFGTAFVLAVVAVVAYAIGAHGYVALAHRLFWLAMVVWAVAQTIGLVNGRGRRWAFSSAAAAAAFAAIGLLVVIF